MIVTTTETVPGRRVLEAGGMVTGNAAYGMNAVRDWFVRLTDFWGGRSKSIITVTKDAEREALAAMIAEAEEMGADAIICARFRTLETGGTGMVGVGCYGTAVTLE